MITKILVILFCLCATLLSGEVTIIGHRGSPCSCPENTLASFKEAMRIGVDFIEFDVHLTQDGVPVVIHDSHLGRNVNASCPHGVNSLTLKELKYYDAGVLFHRDFRGEKIPTLEEVFEIAHGKVGMMIEIKTGTASEKRLAEEVMRVVKRATKSDKPILIGGFSPKVLEHIRKIDPLQPIIALVKSMDELEGHFKNNPEYFGLKWSLATPGLIEWIHERGQKVWVWTVNHVEEMKNLALMGVDGLISNNPSLCFFGPLGEREKRENSGYKPMAMKECREMTVEKSRL